MASKRHESKARPEDDTGVVRPGGDAFKTISIQLGESGTYAVLSA
jgi:hypothetical protein